MKKILAKILLFTMTMLLGSGLASITARADEIEPTADSNYCVLSQEEPAASMYRFLGFNNKDYDFTVNMNSTLRIPITDILPTYNHDGFGIDIDIFKHATIKFENDELVYIPNEGFAGQDNIYYSYTDSNWDLYFGKISFHVVDSSSIKGNAVIAGPTEVNVSVNLYNDVNNPENKLSAAWGSNSFEATEITSLTFISVPFKMMKGNAIGVLNNGEEVNIEFTFFDDSSLGDAGTIVITDNNGTEILNTAGDVSTGDINIRVVD